MRILHTSDWHLGHSFHQYDRTFEHEMFLDWLKKTLREEKIDALLVAGDIFDSANPPVSAQKQLNRFLIEARRLVPHLNVILTAGNHDSPSRLEIPSPLLEDLGAKVIGQVPRSEEGTDWKKLVVPLKDSNGDTKAWCIAMPFLRPSDLPRVETVKNPYAQGIAAAYKSALEHALKIREQGQAILAIGHCHIAKAQVSEESERQIIIGGEEALPPTIFDSSIAYVALGHLHRAQTIDNDNSRRYSGSPIPMSFSEIDYDHQVVIVDFEKAILKNVRSLPIPRAVPLLSVPSQPEPLAQVIEKLKNLNLSDEQENLHPYLRVRIELEGPEPNLRAHIENALMGKSIRLAKIDTSRKKAALPYHQTTGEVDELVSFKPIELFQRLYQEIYSIDAPPELKAAFNELLNTPVEADKK